MKKIIHVSGMHCVSCEILLEKEIQEIPGVEKCKASQQKGTLEIEGEEIPLEKITKMINGFGYAVVEKNHENPSKITLKDLLQIALLGGALFEVLWIFSLFDINWSFQGSQDIGFSLAFLVGILASISTCLALVGGIVMSFSSNYETSSKEIHPLVARGLPQLFFHTGRIGSFFLLGGLLGIFGGFIQYTPFFSGILTILVAGVMLIVGLHLLNLAPNITRLGIHFPKSLTKKISNLQKSKNPLVPAVLGALTFFVPCGFTQSMQLVAMASGSFWMGGLIMTFFALGTFPVLFLAGVGSSYAHNRDSPLFKKSIGVLILFFSIFSLNSGLVLMGSNVTLDFWKRGDAQKSIVADTPKNQESVQVITLDVDSSFRQSNFEVKRGVPVRFEINAINPSGCTNEVIIPRLGLSSGKLQKGKIAVLEFTPNESGVIPFSCWMGMQGGKIIVSE